MSDIRPTVSIIMPVYNASGFLESCIESIISQDFKTWELIMVNDFSTDSTLEIMKEYAGKDARIRFLHNEEKGIIPALNKAFSIASGDYITRMDADDRMPSYKLSALLRAVNPMPARTIVTGKVEYFSDGTLQEGFLKYASWLNARIDQKDHWNHIYKECVIPSACWMARKEDLNKINAFEESNYPEDYDLVFRWYQAGFQVHGIDKVLHLWRDHSERASRTDPNYADQHFFDLKVSYFLDIDHDPASELVIWGCGKKGKKLVQLFLDHDITPRWITNNPNKIGKDIYGIIIESDLILETLVGAQVITVIAQKGFKAKKSNYIQIFQF